MDAMMGAGVVTVPRWRPFGASLRLHWSAALLAVFYGYTTYSAAVYRLDGDGTIIGVSCGAAVCFLLSIFLHECAHAALCRHYGASVTSILLYAFGGLTSATPDAAHEPRKSMQVLVAVAGPASNALLGGALIGVALLLRDYAGTWWYFLLWWLGYSNLVLAVFNMLPGVPLDGAAAVTGLLRYCFNEYRSKLFGYSAGIIVVLAVMVAVCIKVSIASGLYLLLIVAFTAYALSELYVREHNSHNNNDLTTTVQ